MTTTTENPYDITVEPTHRLKALIANSEHPAKENFETSANNAAIQLELLTPAVLGASKKGVIAGLFAEVPTGTMLVIVANPDSVATIGLAHHDDRAAMLKEMTEYVITLQPDWNNQEIAPLTNLYLDNYGGSPDTSARKDVPQQAVEAYLGCLFRLHGEGRNSVIDNLEKMAKDNICPVVVALVAPSKAPGKLAFFTGILPLAPYVESIDD